MTEAEASMELHKGQFLRALGVSLVTGLGVVLDFTVLNNYAVWIPILVAALAIGVLPFLAGWLSSNRRYAVLFPVTVFGSLAVASAIGGPISTDSDTVGFIALLSAIYGGLAAAPYFVGWLLADTFLRRRYGG